MPNLLLLDLGNTRLKWATAAARSGAKITPRGAVARPERSLLQELACDPQYKNHRAVVSCVVPKYLPVIRRAFGARLLLFVEGTSPHLGYGFTYPEPAQLGADRLADAAAAHALGHFPALTINCGTATVFNVLDARGRFAGGVILPGWLAQMEALVSRTAQLPRIDFAPPRRFLATSTKQALQAGALLSFRGGIRATLAALLAEIASSSPPAVYLTGGNAKLAGKELPVPVTIKPLLTFTGLHIIGCAALRL